MNSAVFYNNGIHCFGLFGMCPLDLGYLYRDMHGLGNAKAYRENAFFN